MAVGHSAARGSFFVEGLTDVLDDGSHRNDHECDAAGAGVGRAGSDCNQGLTPLSVA